MIGMLRGLSGQKYSPVTYVVANTDTSSLVRLSHASNVLDGAETYIHKIPRSREVKQGWISTIFSTLRASIWSIHLIFKINPELILVNGPGTCVPICGAAVLVRILGFGNPTIIFVESFCRVKSLSLSGKIIYPFADRFIVQWPEIKETYSRVEFLENLY